MDEDFEANGRVRYSIRSVSNNGRSKFAIDAVSGMIVVTDRVVRGEQYIITVEAEDMAPAQNRRSVSPLNDFTAPTPPDMFKLGPHCTGPKPRLPPGHVQVGLQMYRAFPQHVQTCSIQSIACQKAGG